MQVQLLLLSSLVTFVYSAPKIIGGDEVDISKIPFIAPQYHRGSFQCAGSIIGPQHILTAGHCVENRFLTPADVTFRIGSSSNRDGGQILQAASYVIHPKFDSFWLDYDVAVVKLTKPIENFTNASIVELVDEKFTIENGKVVSVAGWGRSDDGRYPEFLRKVDVPVLDHKTCEPLFGEPLTDNMICAGVPGKDSCNGDSGGPLYLEDACGKVLQLGVVSFGPTDCGRNFGVYSFLSHHEIRSFIREHSGI